MITIDRVNELEKLIAKISGLYEEISALSKKSPNDGINSFKLNIVNSVVNQCNDFLGTEDLPIEEFSQFEEDQIPSNSDVVFVLAQYDEALEKVRSDNIKRHAGLWVYSLPEAEDRIPTAPPRKLIRK